MQFSIRRLLFVIAAIAIALAALMESRPVWLAGLLLMPLMLGLPGIAVAAIVYGRGLLRAFAIGAILPLLAGSALATALLADSGWGAATLAAGTRRTGTRRRAFAISSVNVLVVRLFGGRSLRRRPSAAERGNLT